MASKLVRKCASTYKKLAGGSAQEESSSAGFARGLGRGKGGPKGPRTSSAPATLPAPPPLLPPPTQEEEEEDDEYQAPSEEDESVDCSLVDSDQDEEEGEEVGQDEEGDESEEGEDSEEGEESEEEESEDDEVGVKIFARGPTGFPDKPPLAGRPVIRPVKPG